MTCKPSFQVPEPLKTAVTPDELKPSGFISVTSTTGLNIAKVAPNRPTIPSVVQYLSNNVDFGNTTEQKNNEWDCVDRALWGIAYARQKFPGMAVGMAMGKASVGSIKDADHAVMIIWDGNNYLYHDPLQPGKPVTFTSIQGVFAFPFGADGQKDIIDPLKSIILDRMMDNKYVHWDTEYKIYPTKTADRRGIEDYLTYAVYDPQCINLDAIDLNYWKAADAALWSYMHVRRHYKGAAIGIAFGVPQDPNKSKVVNIIWAWDPNTKKIKTIFWDPLPQFKMEVGFTPKRIFF